MMADTRGSPTSSGMEPQKIGDTVVIAMDGSEYSDYALQFYLDEIHKPGNNLIIVTSTEVKSISYPAVGGLTADAYASMMTSEIAAQEKQIDALVDKLTQKLQNLKIDSCKIERIHGEAGPAIITLANEKHADYIVIGCRGKGSVRRTLTGSVTDYVSHHAKVPVMVARHKDHIKHHHGIHFHNPFSHHKKGDKHVPKSP